VLAVLGFAGATTRLSAQTTIFSENLGIPTTTSGFAIATYATGTAPATFQNAATLTYGIGDQAGAADIRKTSTSNNSGASGEGNVFFSSSTAAGDRGFSVESINASGFNTLQLSYGYRKNSGTAFAGLSVDYWNGAAWITVANTSNDLFNELAAAATGWYAAKTLSLPAGAQIAGLKLRFVKSGAIEIRIDDIKLTGTPAGGDVTAPTIASLSPLNSSIDVATTTSVIATFDEAVQAGTGAITLKKTSDSSTVPATVAIAGSSLTIEPTSPLELGTAYNVQIELGAIKDLANNNFLGITNATTWAFITDSTAPTLTATLTPLNNATGIAPPTTLSATFNEPVNLPFASGTSTITVRNSGGTAVATFDPYIFGEGVAVSGSVLTLTIPSGTPLDYGSTYYVEIGAGAVTNDSGLPFAGFTGNTTWTFSTVNVPNLTTGPGYSQDFSLFTSATNLTDATPLLPLGWAVSTSAIPPLFSYGGDFGTSPTAGFRGNSNVLGYQHSGSSGLLTEKLTLRNTSGADITNLTVSYHGRGAGPATTASRNPAFTVTVNGTAVSGLSYSTLDGDDVTRAASITGLSIPNNATFSIVWNSDGPNAPGTGSRRQIGISAVSVAIGVAEFAPTVTAGVPLGTVTYNSAELIGTVVSEGTSPITARGFVYSPTVINPSPIDGGTGVITVLDPAVGVDPYTAVISGLSSSTNYTVRAYATNSVNTAYSSPVIFSTVATPPTYTGVYEQPFDAYAGSNPDGWTAVSSGGAQGYAGAWGNDSGSAGFTGGVSNPGVLGYQHTGGTGTLTTTLKLFNGTGTTITQLPVAYLGRVSRTTEGRSPTFVVAVNGVEVSALAYSTLANLDVSLSTTVTGLSIAPGALITITWVSTRGDGADSSKQIGLGEVVVGTVPVGNTYATWATTNAGGQGSTLDFDNDGVANGVEYFFGATGSTFTPNPQPNALGLISFPHPIATPGTTYEVKTSPDLVNWTPVTTSESGGFVNYTIPSGLGKVFVRLEVVVPTP
jgi:hypothetical protein